MSFPKDLVFNGYQIHQMTDHILAAKFIAGKVSQQSGITMEEAVEAAKRLAKIMIDPVPDDTSNWQTFMGALTVAESAWRVIMEDSGVKIP